MGNLKMDIPEKLATLGTQDTGRTQTQKHATMHTQTQIILDCTSSLKLFR